MIRFSNINDIPQIISLWREAFGDSEREIKFFLDEWYNPCNTLVCELNEEIVSVLFLLEGSLCADNTEYPAYYLYAACTARKCRGKGIMGKLLAFAEKTAAERSFDFICLMPSEKSLFDFYSKFGYIPAFSTNFVSFSAKEYKELGFKPERVTKVDSDFLQEIRDSALRGRNYFKWNGRAIDFAVAQNKLYGGCLISACNGYCLYAKNGETTVVKELVFTETTVQSLIAFLFESCGSDKYVLRLPPWVSLNFGKSSVTESAMLLPVTGRAKELAPHIKEAYLGLTLD